LPIVPKVHSRFFDDDTIYHYFDDDTINEYFKTDKPKNKIRKKTRSVSIDISIDMNLVYTKEDDWMSYADEDLEKEDLEWYYMHYMNHGAEYFQWGEEDEEEEKEVLEWYCYMNHGAEYFQWEEDDKCEDEGFEEVTVSKEDGQREEQVQSANCQAKQVVWAQKMPQRGHPVKTAETKYENMISMPWHETQVAQKEASEQRKLRKKSKPRM